MLKKKKNSMYKQLVICFVLVTWVTSLQRNLLIWLILEYSFEYKTVQF